MLFNRKLSYEALCELVAHRSVDQALEKAIRNQLAGTIRIDKAARLAQIDNVERCAKALFGLGVCQGETLRQLETEIAHHFAERAEFCFGPLAA